MQYLVTGFGPLVISTTKQVFGKQPLGRQQILNLDDFVMDSAPFFNHLLENAKFKEMAIYALHHGNIRDARLKLNTQFEDGYVTYLHSTPEWPS